MIKISISKSTKSYSYLIFYINFISSKEAWKKPKAILYVTYFQRNSFIMVMFLMSEQKIVLMCQDVFGKSDKVSSEFINLDS